MDEHETPTARGQVETTPARVAALDEIIELARAEHMTGDLLGVYVRRVLRDHGLL